jgi:nitroreductase
MISDLIKKCRSYRRFLEDVKIGTNDLREMIDNARLSASGRNAQTLKYIIANDSESCAKVFPCLSWAGYLKKWNGPEEGERPSAYIIMLNDTNIATNYFCDHGIAAQSILLTAVEKGYGGCIIASVMHEKLSDTLEIPSQYDIIQVIALGKPKETVVIDPMGVDGDFKYWRDENQVHHVPKRNLDDIILK